jgi:hypothetical protein
MKNFVYFAAVSVAVIAQAASAQTTQITNQAVTLKAVTPRTQTKLGTVAATVTVANGTVWSFGGNGDIAAAGATKAGAPVAPGTLTAGMSCVLTGTRSASGNTITKLAC